MWEVDAVSEDRLRVPVPVYQDAGRIVSRNLIRDLVFGQAFAEHPEAPRAAHLVEEDIEEPHIFDEASGSLGVEAITLWASGAAEAFLPSRPNVGDELRLLGDVGLSWFETGTPRVSAWHDETICVIPVGAKPRDLRIRYVPEAADEDLRFSLERELGGESAAFLDCRGYFGAQSIVADVRRSLGSAGEAVLRVGGYGAGVIVGRILRLVGKVPVAPSEDLTWRSRLAALTAKSGLNAEGTFDLSSTPLIGDSCIVVVHGTASCGITNCFDLMLYNESPPGPTRIYRYEHDTFRKIEDNAVELASLLARSPDIREVLLVAHSRGGLVARRAAQILGAKPPVQIWTYGSPHLGTPLVDGIRRFPGLVLTLGSLRRRGVPQPDRVTAAFSYLLGACKELPPGIASMAEGHEVLDMIRNNGDSCVLRAHGAEFDGQSAGFTVGFSRSVFNGVPNDTVVPVPSAIGAGEGRTLQSSCAHSEYFLQSAVQQDIFDYIAARHA